MLMFLSVVRTQGCTFDSNAKCSAAAVLFDAECPLDLIIIIMATTLKQGLLYLYHHHNANHDADNATSMQIHLFDDWTNFAIK